MLWMGIGHIITQLYQCRWVPNFGKSGYGEAQIHCGVILEAEYSPLAESK